MKYRLFRGYLIGGMIGMLIEYLCRVPCKVWYYPLSIVSILIVLMVIDINNTKD